MAVLVDTDGQRQSVKLIKRLVKSEMPAEDVSLEMFQVVFNAKREDVCKAFQHLLFGEEEVKKSAEDIDKAVRRLRGLFTHTTAYRQEEFKAELYIAAREGQMKDNGFYPVSGYVDHMFNKITTDLYHYLSKDGTTKQQMLQALRLLKEKYADEARWMMDLERKCDKIFKGKRSMTKAEFRQVIQYQKELADRIFEKFDRSKSGVLNINELYEGLVGILTSDTEGKLKYLFDIYDVDGSGALGRQEIHAVLSMCVSESTLDLHEDVIEELSNIVWGNLTDWSRDKVTFLELFRTLQQYPSVYNNIGANVIGSADVQQTFKFLQTSKKKRRCQLGWKVRRSCVHLAARFNSNMSLWMTVVVYIGVSVGLIAERVYQLMKSDTPMTHHHILFIIAKVAGQLLNFNISLILLFAIKHMFAELKKCTFLRKFIPLDDLLFLHKTVAVITLMLGLIHTLAHVCAIGVKGTSLTYYLKDSDKSVKKVFITGLVIVGSGIVIALTSLSSLKKCSFQMFIRIHQLCATIWVVCMILHGANFWKWILLPVVLFVGERLYFTYLIWLNRTRVKSGIVYGEIIRLTIKRPKHFKYEPGDYVNINIPHVSRSGWHPFTISSSTDHRPDYFTLHIRKVGKWTGKLHRAVRAESKKSLNGNGENYLHCDSKNSQLTPDLGKDRKPVKRNSSTEADVHLLAHQFQDESMNISLSDITGECWLENGTALQESTLDMLTSGASLSTHSCSDKLTDRTNDLNKSLSTTTVNDRETSMFNESNEKFATSSTLPRAASLVDEEFCLGWKVFLDGPYSTPSKEILNTRHAIMVAGGIGVTPFASILESVMSLLKERTDFKFCDRLSPDCLCQRRQISLEKINFFWITRDQTNLSWFYKVFKEIEEAQRLLGISPPLVNLHIYLTGLKTSSDIRGAFLQLALEMAYNVENCDVISGLQARTKAGRPEWSELLKEITMADSVDEKLGRPKLYVCGPNSLCHELKKSCYRNNIVYKQEVF